LNFRNCSFIRKNNNKSCIVLSSEGFIILFFYFGGVIGGLGYFLYGMKILLLAVAILMGAIVYGVRLTIVTLKRKYIQ
jgi:hypothetical protein